MKNFQQAPKQRRVDMAKQKQRIQAAKPIIVFEQQIAHKSVGWNHWFTYVTILNKVHHINGKR